MKKDYLETKQAYYKNNKHEVLKARIIKKINEHLKNPDVEISIKSSTLKKYGLIDEKGKVTIPKDYKPKIIYSEHPDDAKNVLNVVVDNKPTPFTKYDNSNVEVTPKEIINFILTELVKMPIKADARISQQNIRSKKTIQTYCNNIKLFFKYQGLKYDEDKNIKPWLTNPDFIVNMLDKTDLSNESKSQKINFILLLLRVFPPLQNTSDEIYNKFNQLTKQIKGTAKADRDKKNAETPIFAWNVISKAIKDYYPKQSYEILLLKLYDYIIARGDDLDLTIINNETEDKGKINYLLLDRKKKQARIIIQDYKTGIVYGKKEIKLKKDVVDLILYLHPTENNVKLFPFTNFSEWLLNTFREPPLLQHENINTKYIRHSIISSKVLALDKDNKDYAKQRQELADLAMHSIDMQKGTYISPLKNGKGKLIDTNEEIIKDFEEFVKEEEQELEEDKIEIVDVEPFTIGQVVKVKIDGKYYKGKIEFAHMAKEDDGTIKKNWRVLFNDGDSSDYNKKQMDKILKIK
jgi:hypothetical protein